MDHGHGDNRSCIIIVGKGRKSVPGAIVWTGQVETLQMAAPTCGRASE